MEHLSKLIKLHMNHDQKKKKQVFLCTHSSMKKKFPKSHWT